MDAVWKSVAEVVSQIDWDRVLATHELMGAIFAAAFVTMAIAAFISHCK